MDVGLYIHVPFCARKCGYCDFYSLVPAASDVDPLVDALLAELNCALGDGASRVETIFIGGGTPSCLPFDSLRRLMAGLSRVVAGDDPIEFTVEANPATLTTDKAALLRDHRVTRISVGAQSFDERELACLGRTHRPDDIPATAGMVHRAGFAHFNLDLIFGIPGQTRESWLWSLKQAVELGPDHLACYGLTYEPRTPLRRELDAGRITRMDEGSEADLYLAAIDMLADCGLKQYEISNFARRGSQCIAPGRWAGAGQNPPGSVHGGTCLHNLRYWLNRPSIGIGPSAASYVDGRRWRNLPDVAEYVRRIRAGSTTAVDIEELAPAARAGETAMLRLRLVEGIHCRTFEKDTGFQPHALFGEAIGRHARAGRLTADDEWIALTREGRLVADAVMADFLLPVPGGPVAAGAARGCKHPTASQVPDKDA